MCNLCFFKQMTANDIRISDWSSDVCSSDLVAMLAARASIPASRLDLRTLSFDSEWFLTFTDWIIFRLHLELARRLDGHASLLIRPTKPKAPSPLLRWAQREDLDSQAAMRSMTAAAFATDTKLRVLRLEENTSQLPSLMRTSCAVLRFKKKKKTATI